MRLILADHDLVLGPGEAAELDTRLPHWFGSTSEGPVEILSLLAAGPPALSRLDRDQLQAYEHP